MTIKDIARESGYAVGTVSRVLNNQPNVSAEAREKILAVVQKYNFKLNNNAKHLKQTANSGITIIVKGYQNMLFSTIVERLQKEIKQKNYACMIYYVSEEDNEVEHAVQIARERHPSGILFLGSDLKCFETEFPKIPVPCVLVTNTASKLHFDNLSSVSTDDVKAAYSAIDYLISLGHTKIGILGGVKEKSNPTTYRYEGCVKAFKKHNIPFSEEDQSETALFSMDAGYRAMNRLLDKNPNYTAVFAMADVLAIGAIRAAYDRGLRVPEDISVIGFDGIGLGTYLPVRLTTIRQDWEKISDHSIEILLSEMSGSTKAVHELVPFEVISGESCRKL